MVKVFVIQHFCDSNKNQTDGKERYKIIYIKCNWKLGFSYNLGVLLISGLFINFSCFVDFLFAALHLPTFEWLMLH
jgi:hypothetical protein